MASTMRFDNWQTTDGTSIATTNASGDITFAGALAASSITGGGKILQVVNATHSTQVVVTSGTYGATGVAASITPSATSSKVLVIITNPMRAWNRNISSTTSGRVYSKLYRDGSEVHDFFAFRYYDNANIQRDMEWNGTLTFVDSPATTSSVSYELYIASDGASYSVYSCYVNKPASITLMEVGA